MLTRVSPEEAQAMMQEQGYVYLDVRSTPEFDNGHPSGAYNIPLLHMTPAGMQPNDAFLSIVEKAFPDRDTKIVVGCKAGGRSMRAAQLLLSAGYTHVVDQRAGFVGATDPFGRLKEAGWQPRGLPVSTVAEEGHAYEQLTHKG